MNRIVIAWLVWVVPVVLLLISLVPMLLPFPFPLILQIWVSIAAAFIAYLLFTRRPPYYIVWGIVFILFVLIFNPIIKFAAFSYLMLPIALITAIIWIANWFVVFRREYPLF